MLTVLLAERDPSLSVEGGAYTMRLRLQGQTRDRCGASEGVHPKALRNAVEKWVT